MLEFLHALCYRPLIDDPDFWMQPEVKPGVIIYYEYVIFYVDDVICISDDLLHATRVIQ